MAKDTRVPTRGEITERTEKTAENLHQKEGDLDKTVSDIETIRTTIENLRLEGTSEGGAEVQRSMDNAEHVTEDIFDREDGELERFQEDNEQHRTEFQERADTSESDRATIDATHERVQTQDAHAELENARQSVLADIDFLKGVVERAREKGEASEQAQREYQERRQVRR